MVGADMLNSETEDVDVAGFTDERFIVILLNTKC